MVAALLMISFILGTPSVMFIVATPAKWKVLSVICVPGSPIDWAPVAPTAVPNDSVLGPGVSAPRIFNSQGISL